MKRFLFFSSDFSGVAHNWHTFLSYFKKEYPQSEVHFLFERKTSRVQEIEALTISQVAVKEIVMEMSPLTQVEIDDLVPIRDKALLSKLRLQRTFRTDSILSDDKVDFDLTLLKEIKFFINYLLENKIEFVVIDLITAFTSLESHVLEAVCDHLNIRKAVSAKPTIKRRIQIFDNTNRISPRMNRIYAEARKNGLSSEIHEKIEAYLCNYIHFKRSDVWINQVFQKLKHKKARKPGFMSKLRNFYIFLGNRGTVNSKGNATYDIFDYKKTPFLLFCPNKPRNHRTYNCSPFYANYSSLIQAISISLPYGYQLVVKDHPHTFHGRNYNLEMLNTIRSIDNCHYISPEIDNYEIAGRAAAIICDASSTGFEMLMLKKHLILFGSKPYVFGSEPGLPVHRVADLEELPNVIRCCLSVPPDEDKIYSYFYAFLKSSFSRDEMISDDDWHKVIGAKSMDAYYKRIAPILRKFIEVNDP